MLLNNCIVKDRKRCCKIDLQIAEMVPLSIKISPNCQSTSLVFNDIKENTDSVDFYIRELSEIIFTFLFLDILSIEDRVAVVVAAALSV